MSWDARDQDRYTMAMISLGMAVMMLRQLQEDLPVVAERHGKEIDWLWSKVGEIMRLNEPRLNEP